MRLKQLGICLVVACLALVGAEGFCRTLLGLGDPPLTLRDPEIEYMFKQGRYIRFGNLIEYNSCSMRSPEPPTTKQPGDVRILLLGDSVINGGALTDQSDLATEILRSKLPGKNDWVGNVSAGSWGPANILAYLQRYGAFDADLAVLVVSSHDLTDIPEFPMELGIDFPTETPPFALWEAITRYLPRYLPSLAHGDAAKETSIDVVDRVEEGQRNLASLLDFLQARFERVAVLHHATRKELTDGLSEDGLKLMALIERRNISHLYLGDYLNYDNYRDRIHVNENGQVVIANIIFKLIM